MPEAATWHYGLVADWWAEFNVDGPEIEYFRRFVEPGRPALDVACGTGRLLVPFLREGLDVDGCDVSADMVARCRDAAARAGVEPTLFVQAMHELDPPRRYATVLVCGGFGLGATRAQDEEALRRFHAALAPGGTLVFDVEVPYAYTRHWPYWLKERRGELPAPWPEAGDARRSADGSELELLGRLVDLDPVEQRVTLALRALRRRAGVVVEREEQTLTINLYFRNELVAMLERAGFEDVRVYGDHTDAPARPEHDFLVFVARRPG